MADEPDSGKCFDSELSEVAIDKKILEGKQQQSDPLSPDHEPSKIGDPSKEETKSENTQMKKVSLEESEPNLATKSENLKKCELGFAGRESPKRSESNLAGNSEKFEMGFAGGDSSKDPDSNGETDFDRNMKNNESDLGIQDTASGDDLKSSELGFAEGESRKESECNLENGASKFAGNVKNCELGFPGGESLKKPGFNLGAEETSTGVDFKKSNVGFAGGDRSKKLKKAEFKSPKNSKNTLEAENTNFSGNFKKREVGFSGGEKMKMWKKVNAQSHTESEHNTETQNTGGCGGNTRNCEVGFAGNEKTKKATKKVSFQSHKESKQSADKEEKDSKKCELGLPGGENTKKWKKKVVKFESPIESKSNLENEDTNSGGNSKKCDLGFAGGQNTKKWKKVVKSELSTGTESNLEKEGANIAGNFKKPSVPKSSPLQEVWKHPVSDDWNSFFDPYGVTFPGAVNPSFNHYNSRRLMGDSSMIAERYDESSRIVNNMFWNMGSPLHNMGIPPWNVGVPLGNMGYPIDNMGILPWNAGLPFRYVGVPLGNVDNLNRSDTSGLKIAVVDDTALIETCFRNPGNGVRKENGFAGSSKPPKRRTITIRKNENGKETNATGSRRGKAKVAAAVESEKAEGGGKRRYSRKEMEALRFKNLDEQRQKWMEVRSGFPADVASEYDGLIDCRVLKQPSSSVVVPQQQLLMNQGTRGILGSGAVYGGGIQQHKLFVH